MTVVLHHFSLHRDVYPALYIRLWQPPLPQAPRLILDLTFPTRGFLIACQRPPSSTSGSSSNEKTTLNLIPIPLQDIWVTWYLIPGPGCCSSVRGALVQGRQELKGLLKGMGGGAGD